MSRTADAIALVAHRNIIEDIVRQHREACHQIAQVVRTISESDTTHSTADDQAFETSFNTSKGPGNDIIAHDIEHKQDSPRERVLVE